MNTNPKWNSRTERLVAGSLLFVAAAISAQNLLHWAKVAEARKLSAAADNYSSVRSMYAEASDSSAPAATRLVAGNVSSSELVPVR
jgi:hypothetical protein